MRRDLPIRLAPLRRRHDPLYLLLVRGEVRERVLEHDRVELAYGVGEQAEIFFGVLRAGDYARFPAM